MALFDYDTTFRLFEISFSKKSNSIFNIYDLLVGQIY